MQQKTGHLYEFGPFVLDTARHLLLREGTPVRLTRKTFDMLLVLIENRGRTVSKDELMAALWPDSVVEESNLTQQVSMIRKALDDKAGEHHFIVTVSGRGYRFDGDVRIPPPADEPIIPTLTEPPLEAGESGPTVTADRRRRSIPVVWVLALIGIAALAYGGYRWVSAKNQGAAVPRTLAILPFQNLRQDPANDFLGVSLADAVITKLDNISALTVRPSSAVEKYRNQVVDIPKIASELRVDTLLTSTFIRDGDDLRITSQLIDTRTQAILWKGALDLKYDRVLTVQDRVAQEIVRGLELSLSPVDIEHLKPEKPIDAMAYEYYLRGVDLYSRSEFPLAIKMLQKSIEIDPAYALTWAHLGRAHTANASFELGGRDEYSAAQVAYEKALSIQPDLIEARIYMANRLTDTGRVENAVPLLREAAKTHPNHAEVHWELGYAYRFGGMLRESIAECRRARELDPGVKLTTSTLNAYLYTGEYAEFLKSLPDTNDSALILFYRGFGSYYAGNSERAARNFDAAFDLHPSLLQARVGKAISFAIRRDYSKALEILHQAENTISERGVGDPEAIYKIAQAYAVSTDKAAALRVLRHSIEHGFFPYPYFASDPLLSGLRSESEFSTLMALARERHETFKRKFF